ncbi:MAG: endonuclease/exonuclease/phosphatase family protein [Spirochaetaceae bacterium]|jgi:endonuclease/exonuclease/phosphatase family metal-dependent hydrolase|nr:endonuclease/exonuclease/phosphatase family protein [Spirochaetaceae bacterium]
MIERLRITTKLCAIAGAVFFSMALSSCFGGGEGHYSGQGALSIATWNLQALFDERDDGWEYEEYRDGAGWTGEKYTARLNHIAAAIGEIGENPPDIIALIEVENRGILEKLSTENLSGQGYKHCFFAGNTGYSLGIGVLSKYPFVRAIAHSINVNGTIIPRPIMEIALQPNDGNLVLFVCHWKSKLGGDEQTEIIRREAVRVILRRQAEIQRETPDIAIAILGDLNENYDEFYRRSGGQVCALMPDDPEAASLAGYSPVETDNEDETKTQGLVNVQDFLILSTEKPPYSSFFAGARGTFYSPWENELKNGSYYYSGVWETIDHFLLNENFFTEDGWHFKNCYVIDCEPFINSKGEPNRYNPRTGSGLSDHLPLLLTLLKTNS